MTFFSMPSRLPLMVVAAALLSLAAACAAFAGTMINEDEARYAYKLYWDDLAPVENGTIGPGDTVTFRESKGIVELVGQSDNIYVRPGETVLIRNGILTRKKK